MVVDLFAKLSWKDANECQENQTWTLYIYIFKTQLGIGTANNCQVGVPTVFFYRSLMLIESKVWFVISIIFSADISQGI